NEVNGEQSKNSPQRRRPSENPDQHLCHARQRSRAFGAHGSTAYLSPQPSIELRCESHAPAESDLTGRCDSALLRSLCAGSQQGPSQNESDRYSTTGTLCQTRCQFS